VLNDGQRELELGYEDAGAGNEFTGLINLGGGDFKACAGHDDDGVLALRGINDDRRRAGGAGRAEEKLRVDAFGFVEASRHVSKGVGTQLGDEAHAAACARSGHGLV